LPTEKRNSSESPHGHKKFYSLKQVFGKILAGQCLGVGVAHYARKLNRMWVKRNRT
jgi:hypothetical protein